MWYSITSSAFCVHCLQVQNTVNCIKTLNNLYGHVHSTEKKRWFGWYDSGPKWWKRDDKSFRAPRTSGLESSLHLNCSPLWGDFAGLLNTYVVNLTFRYNYAHFSRSSLCHCVSYQPSMWRAALTDGSLIFHSTASTAALFQHSLLCLCSRDQRAIDTVWTDPSRLPCLSDTQFALQSLRGCRSDNALL